MIIIAETYLLDLMKDGTRQRDALFPNVKKILIDLRNPFARYRSTTSQQLTLSRGVSQSKPKN